MARIFLFTVLINIDNTTVIPFDMVQMSVLITAVVNFLSYLCPVLFFFFHFSAVLMCQKPVIPLKKYGMPDRLKESGRYVFSTLYAFSL